MPKHIDIKVYGKVQGVYFREETKRKADEIKVFGSVKNNSDGTVSIEVEGESDKVDRFLVWLRGGVSGSKIERIETSYGNMKNDNSFRIEW
jgi:acylphosphatase